jgi:crotonobetainyl-CoA:carnitine CoA-transferase CaiB-like acyl-CoA transferase
VVAPRWRPPAGAAAAVGDAERLVQVQVADVRAVVARPRKPAGFRASDPNDPNYLWFYVDNAVERVRHRKVVTETLNEITSSKPSAWWIENLERNNIGCGPINFLSEVFEDPQVKAREMVIEMPHPATGKRPAKLIASPIRLSSTPVTYRQAPPLLGQHTEELLGEYLGMAKAQIDDLRARGIV